MNEIKPIYKRMFILFIVGLFIYGAYSGGIKANKINIKNNLDLADADDSVPADNINFDNSNGETNKTEDNAESSEIDYDKFLNIKIGASYDEVKKILGSSGKEISSSSICGVKNAMYEWDGKGIHNITITLQNNVVISKAQLGLKENNSTITLDQYNSISNGSSYENIKGTIGEGQLMSETSTGNSISCVYSYINPDGSNANLTFESDKLKMKAQYNLK